MMFIDGSPSSEPNQLLERLREVTATPNQFSTCVNLSEDCQHELELILLKAQIASTVYSGEYPKFTGRELTAIEQGHRKLYPEDRIEGFFSRFDALPLLILILATRKYGNSILLAIAALPHGYRQRLLDFVYAFQNNNFFKSCLQRFDEHPSKDLPDTLIIIGTNENRDIVFLTSPPSRLKSYVGSNSKKKRSKADRPTLKQTHWEGEAQTGGALRRELSLQAPPFEGAPPSGPPTNGDHHYPLSWEPLRNSGRKVEGPPSEPQIHNAQSRHNSNGENSYALEKRRRLAEVNAQPSPRAFHTQTGIPSIYTQTFQAPVQAPTEPQLGPAFHTPVTMCPQQVQTFSTPVQAPTEPRLPQLARSENHCTEPVVCSGQQIPERGWILPLDINNCSRQSATQNYYMSLPLPPPVNGAQKERSTEELYDMLGELDNFLPEQKQEELYNMLGELDTFLPEQKQEELYNMLGELDTFLPQQQGKGLYNMLGGLETFLPQQ